MIQRHQAYTAERAGGQTAGELAADRAEVRQGHAEGLQARPAVHEARAGVRLERRASHHGRLRGKRPRRRPHRRRIAYVPSIPLHPIILKPDSSTHDGQTHWLYRIPARAAAGPLGPRAHPRLERVPPPPGAGQAPRAGRPLHGLRRPVLPHRHPAQRHGLRLPHPQPHPRVERPGLSRPVERSARAPAQDQQLPRLHRPRLPGPLRGLLRPGHQRPARHHQEPRMRHH